MMTQPIDIKQIIEEYKIDTNIFSEEKNITRKIKHIIFNKLDEVDRRVILLYAELGSLRKLGKLLKISASSAYLKVKQIKQKIKNEL